MLWAHVKGGWRLLGDISLAHWLLTLLVPGTVVWSGWNSPYFPFVIAAAFVVFGIAFLCVLAFRGYREEARRMPLVDLFLQAEKKGFGFVGEVGVSPIDFASRLRQSALDGQITFWGKPRRNEHERLIKLEPWVVIPREHWKEYEINWLGAFDIGPPDGRISRLRRDNFPLQSYSLRADPPGKGGFADLQIDHRQGVTWLRQAAKALKS